MQNDSLVCLNQYSNTNTLGCYGVSERGSNSDGGTCRTPGWFVRSVPHLASSSHWWLQEAVYMRQRPHPGKLLRQAG